MEKLIYWHYMGLWIFLMVLPRDDILFKMKDEVGLGEINTDSPFNRYIVIFFLCFVKWNSSVG
jgi:hypothetical protein